MIVFTTSAFCQKQQLSTANSKYENLAYYESVELYKKLLKKGYRSAEVYQKIGDSYYFNGNYKEAAPYYKALFGLKKPVAAEYYFRYVQSLKAQNKYDLADKFLEQLPEQFKSDSRFKIFQDNTSYLRDIKSENNFKVDTTSINSPYSDFGAFVIGNKFYFASSRDTSGTISRKHSWTDQSFLKLYQAEMSESAFLTKPKRLKTNFSKKLNQSSPIITKDGKIMYFTQNNSNDRKRIKNSNGKTLLKIFRAIYDGTQWSNAVALPFNSDNYNCAHPAFSIDEKFLYFSSDMPGSYGASDIYKVEIFEDGSFSNPVNLGNKINTEGRETFPFISADNILYFASDGRAGLGGLDIYQTDLNSNDDFSSIENLGFEINSNSDDFAFYINNDNSTGFFSSNRSNGLGFDDIYKFSKSAKCLKSISGTVIDIENNNHLEGVSISLLNNDGKKLQSTITDKAGNFLFEKVECDKAYVVNISKDFYDAQEQIVSLKTSTNANVEVIKLEKTLKSMQVGDDLAKILSIENIYFDLDKFNIRPDAEYELTKILLILQKEPQMEISIRSHTDSRASKVYNHQLSTNRAQSTMQWLVRNGIAAKRLKAAGFGESQLLNNCFDGVDCSEAEHQVNRRSEFIITKM